MFIVFMLTVMVLTACMPWILKALASYGYIPKPKLTASLGWLPALATALFFISYSLPVIPIHGTDTFQQHFVGGGLYCACLFAYLSAAFRWKMPKYTPVIFLFAFVSALGVANELFEFTLHQLNLVQIDISDTSWDLVANTLGAFVGYGILRMLIRSK